jgi:hypothetical protein
MLPILDGIILMLIARFKVVQQVTNILVPFTLLNIFAVWGIANIFPHGCVLQNSGTQTQRPMLEHRLQIS